MAQTEFEKVMKNVNISGERKKRPEKYTRRSWQFNVDVAFEDVTRARRYMLLELEYYNWIVTGLGSRLRTTPSVLLESAGEAEVIFGKCAYEMFDPYRATIKNDDNFPLPESLEPHRNFIFGRDEKGRRTLADRIALLFQLAGERAPIIPEVRKNLAVQALQWYREQAKISLQKVPNHLKDEQVYKTAPTDFGAADIVAKRHLQIPRKVMSVKWDEANERTVFRIPYLTKPIYVTNVNFEENTNWNYSILHQETGGIATNRTPWVFDIRLASELYLLKYRDNNNAYRSAFSEAKRGIQRQ